MDIQGLFYLPFGNNFIVGSHIKKQLKFLNEIIPQEFKGKELYDLGCGDGKITLKFKKIFKPKKIYGCDVRSSLVWRAKKRGIEAKVFDLEKEVPKGELAVFWGVLHHLKNKEKVLKKVKDNFQYLFLKEPLIVKNKRTFLELGKPFFKKDIEIMLKNVFGEFQEYEYQNSILVFWKK